MKWTKLALACAAVLALSAATASVASAKTYNANAANVMLFGTQTFSTKHVLSVDGQNLECTNVNMEVANVASGANVVNPIVATYNGCTIFGFNGNVNVGTCAFTFGEPNITDNVNAPNVPMAEMGINCGNNGDVNNLPNTGDLRLYSTVFGSECEVHIDSQPDRTTVSFTNSTPNTGKVRVHFAVNGLTATKNKDNGLCPLSGLGTTNNVTYKGSSDFEGTSGVGFGVS